MVKTVDGSKIHQWQGVLLPTCRNNESAQRPYFKTIDQSIPTKPQTANTTTTTKQERTHRRCTGNNKPCTHQRNIHTKKDFNKKHSSSTCTQEYNGDSHGRYQHTHRKDNNVVHNNNPYQGHRHSSGRGEKVVSQTGRSQGNHNFISDIREHDGGVHNNGPYGMVTTIKRTIPSEEAEHIHLGDGTETLSIRIWLNKKKQYYYTICMYVDGELDVKTPLSREPISIMVGDFNARDEMWCSDHNRAGRLLNDQLQNLDSICLMKHPQVSTTINKTEIDLSILPVDMVPLTDGSIYPGYLEIILRYY